MGKLIRVQPTRENRRTLAMWARTRRGTRTVSSVEFGFPPRVFTAIPEELLIGALVDSRPYVPRREVVPTAPVATAAVAPASVPDPADPVRMGGPSGAVDEPSAEVIPAEDTTTTAGPVEVAVTDPEAQVPEGAHLEGDGCRPPHPPVEPTPAGASVTVDVEQVAVETDPGPAVNADTGEETAACTPLPEVPESAYGPEAEQLPGGGDAPAETPTVVDQSTTGRKARRQARRSAGAGKLTCPEPGCGFRTSSEHGRAIHFGRTGHGQGGGEPG